MPVPERENAGPTVTPLLGWGVPESIVVRFISAFTLSKRVLKVAIT